MELIRQGEAVDRGAARGTLQLRGGSEKSKITDALGTHDGTILVTGTIEYFGGKVE